MDKIKNIIKDPGVLFSLFHVPAFFVTAGASSPIFALSLASLAISTGFSALQHQVLPNSLKIPSGAALSTNGAMLAMTAGVALAAGNIPAALIAGLYTVSNLSKGMEISGLPCLKSVGEKLFLKKTNLHQTVKNTAFSAEFAASAGAFAVAYNAVSPVSSSIGMGIASVTLITLGASDNDIEKPTWQKIPALKQAFALEVQKSPISDIAMSRYVMGGIAIGNGVVSFLSPKSGLVMNC